MAERASRLRTTLTGILGWEGIQQLLKFGLSVVQKKGEAYLEQEPHNYLGVVIIEMIKHGETYKKPLHQFKTLYDTFKSTAQEDKFEAAIEHHLLDPQDKDGNQRFDMNHAIQRFCIIFGEATEYTANDFMALYVDDHVKNRMNRVTQNIKEGLENLEAFLDESDSRFQRKLDLLEQEAYGTRKERRAARKARKQN